MESSELDELQKDFMNAFEDRKNSLEQKYVVYLDIIKEVYERLNSSTADQEPMTKNQQERFKKILREFFESGVEEAEIFKEGNKNKKDNSFKKFLQNDIFSLNKELKKVKKVKNPLLSLLSLRRSMIDER